MKAELRTVPPPPPQPTQEVVLTLTVEEAKLLRDIVRFDASIPELLGNREGYSHTIRKAMSSLLLGLQWTLNPVLP